MSAVCSLVAPPPPISLSLYGMWWWFGQGCGGGGSGGMWWWRWWRDVVVEVVAGMWKKRSAKKRFQEDIESCMCGEEVSQTLFNERSARKQTSCGIQTFARVCAAQT
ncbi:hypothetical protein Hanom_Chr07g00665731 [Helianthus anomalus]